MKRGEILWADLGSPIGRRPALVVTRDSAIDVLDRLTIVPLSTTVRGVITEVPLGSEEGLKHPCVAACDSVMTVAKPLLDEQPIGSIGLEKTFLLDQALRFALDIHF